MNDRDALILVDIQNDFLPGGTLAVPDGNAIIPVANLAMEHFDLIIATQDWHPADHGSFAANHLGRCVGEVIDLNGLPQVLWPVHCVQRSRGAEMAPDLQVAKVHRIFRKGTDPAIDSYSGFFDNGHRRSTGLGEFLHQRNVERVYVLGLATDYCVKFTALDAVAAGFKAYLIEDGCRGVDLRPGDVAAALAEMQRAGVMRLRTADIPARGRPDAIQ